MDSKFDFNRKKTRITKPARYKVLRDKTIFLGNLSVTTPAKGLRRNCGSINKKNKVAIAFPALDKAKALIIIAINVN